MVDSKEKGSRAELSVRDYLRKHTGYNFERTPLSGAMHEKHGLKGDLYIPNENNRYVIEVKHYCDDHLTSKVLTGKDPQLLQFWQQTVREANQVHKEPLLIFKFDRSKLFVAYEDEALIDDRFIYIQAADVNMFFYVSMLDSWIKSNPRFIE